MPYIYQIKCLENDKRYIGYTTDFNRRKSKHLSALRKCRSHCDEMQRDFDIFGETNFEFSILKQDCNKEDEKNLINKISYNHYLYNREHNPNKKTIKPYILDRDKRVNIYMTHDLQSALRCEAELNSRTIAGQILFYIKKCVGAENANRSIRNGK